MTSTAPADASPAAPQLVPSPVLDVSVELVTPELATQWLGANTRNRTMNARTLQKYVADLRAGRWVQAGDAIRFSTAGTLLDGQHRLAAIVETGMAHQFVVVRGLAEESQTVMDSGRTRTLSDQLGLEGFTNTTNLAATTRLALAWSTGRLRSMDSISHAEAREFLGRFPELADYSQEAVHLRSRGGLAMTTTVLATGMWGVRVAGGDLDMLREFCQSMADSRTDGMGDPRHALVSRLNRARDTRENITKVQGLSLFVRTWNAWVRGDRLHKLTARRGDESVAIPAVIATRPAARRAS